MEIMDGMQLTVFPIKKKNEKENKTMPQHSSQYNITDFWSRKGSFQNRLQGLCLWKSFQKGCVSCPIEQEDRQPVG